jgi:hypothetical protein
MFWSLGHFSSPSIDTILDREGGFTLEDLLEEDELLQECKAQNAKLTELCARQCCAAWLTFPPRSAWMHADGSSPWHTIPT